MKIIKVSKLIVIADIPIILSVVSLLISLLRLTDSLMEGASNLRVKQCDAW
jgi:hypothetical protein